VQSTPNKPHQTLAYPQDLSKSQKFFGVNMKKPLIGITTYRTENPYGNPILALGENYVQALSRAGALPVMIPLGLPEDQIDRMLSRLGGILFSGGGDIDPSVFGAETTPKVKSVDPDRDRVEMQLLRTAHSKGLPFLGICRGFQVINVACGGTLYTHVEDQHPQALKHDFYPDWPRDHLPHAVKVDPDSRLADILGTTEPEVNSLHHQGVRDLAPGLRATAYAPDGLIEAFEMPDHPFGLAVQWHPEWLLDHAPMRALFRAFVVAAAP
jgi:putative glutamine amidotransferase